MSVVVCIKEGDTVYLGADTQTTLGSRKKLHFINETGFKIKRTDEGILLGACGAVQTTQFLYADPDIFRLNENGELTKEWIVNEIVPKAWKKMKEEKLLDEDGYLESIFLLAYKDKVYQINHDLRVISRGGAFAIGAGQDFSAYPLMGEEGLGIRERMLKAMEICGENSDSISAPYIFIDTKNLEYEIVEGGKR